VSDYLDLPVAMAIGSTVVGLILYSRWRAGRRIASVGLVPAYVMNLCLIHWPGAVVYLLPWYWGGDTATVEAGFAVTVYGIAAFALGSVILAPLVGHLFGFPRSTAPARVPERLLPRMYMCVGLVCYVLLLTVAGGIPTGTALVAAGWTLVVVGLGLSCWMAWKDGRRSFFAAGLMATAALPLFTLLSQGFVSYGIAAFFAVLALIVTFTRPRAVWMVVALLVVYVGLSFYVTYMRDRSAIRGVVWRGGSVEDRVGELALSLSDPEWFDPYDVSQLERIDERLNQNALVGAAVRYLEIQQNPFARGETLWHAVIAVVPRAVWPDKPVEAGSGDLVSTYTGIPFQTGTSIGIGQVMEFYINFGRTGVVVGFMLLGMALAMMDAAAYQRLVKDDWQGFALWYLPGLSMLQVGGSLVEVTASAAAALVTVTLVNRFVVPDLRGRPVAHAAEDVGGQAG
jgi:predicted membrane channel-forming protein YqfA (hemolysin III family)